MIWLLIFTALTVLSYNCKININKSNYKKYETSLILVLSIIVAFGGIVCTDNEQYAYFYKTLQLADIKDLDFAFTKTINNRYEIGFLLLSFLCKFLHLGVVGFFLTIALFVNGVFVKFLFQYKNPVLCIIYLVVSGLLMQEANLVRQYVAAAIFTVSVKWLIERDWAKFMMCIIIASSFHTSALILLLFVPICFVDVESKTWYRYVLYGIYGVSLLAMFGRVSFPLLEYASVFINYDDYLTNDNKIGMEISYMRLVLFNIMSLYVLLTKPPKSIVLITILVIETVLTNLSSILPNIARLCILFDVVSFTCFFNSLSEKVKIHPYRNIGNIVKITIIFYVGFMVLREYVFTDNVLLLSKTYSITDLIDY